MDSLIIQLTGEITETNFDEWKKTLIAELDNLNQELTTDEDFVSASEQVKRIKSAEKALKEAKESAIKQAEDIQKLFANIDEISSAARTARLSLEKQIKSRKLEIKSNAVNDGVKRVRAFIDDLSPELKLINLSDHTDRGRFEEATKGKRGFDGLRQGIDDLVEEIKGELAVLSDTVTVRSKRLGKLDEIHRGLFPDKAMLFTMSKEDLDATIDERIKKFEAVQKEQVAIDSPPEKVAGKEGQMELEVDDEKSTEPKDVVAPFQIIIDAEANQEGREKLYKDLEKVSKAHGSVKAIRIKNVS